MPAGCATARRSSTSTVSARSVALRGVGLTIAARRRISPARSFKIIRPGEPATATSMDAPAVSSAAGASGRAGRSPASSRPSAASRVDDEPRSGTAVSAYAELDTRPRSTGLDDQRSPAATSIIQRLRLDLERQVRRPLRAGRRAMRCAARSRTASARRRCTSNSYAAQSTNIIGGVPVDTVDRWRSTVRSRMALGATPLEAGEIGQLSFGATAPNPLRGLNVTARRLPDQDQGPHRPHRESDGDARCSSAIRRGTCNPRRSRSRDPQRHRLPDASARRASSSTASTRRTKGVDLVATYRIPVSASGRLNLTAAYNYNKTKIDKRFSARARSRRSRAWSCSAASRSLRFTDGPAARQDRAQRRRRLGDGSA